MLLKMMCGTYYPLPLSAQPDRLYIPNDKGRDFKGRTVTALEDNHPISQNVFDRLYKPCVRGCVNMVAKPLQKHPLRSIKTVGYVAEFAVKLTANHGKSLIHSQMNSCAGQQKKPDSISPASA